ncbi:DUF6803 family protein [Gloeothece verrucosa]|uniref:Permease n=1 Tax=Gloeothece verrucosa (strain PCC 7822) TaxID=497965 RepID=E0UER0_GLOV7|nr:DUF6803 family protein [Gloeothece verrucosa]ADN16628.1 permease [Gloeothece verrucosa PCC 7822]
MMEMTHYMQLLADNQPWNLLIFMAIPVILAETIAVSELYILFTRDLKGRVRAINKIAGITVGFYFLIVFFYLLFKAVIPITLAGEWRTIIDVIAVGFYLLGVVPLFGISLLELGLIPNLKKEESKLQLHATFVAIFLIVAHIAMIFGMLSPALLGGHSSMPM